MLSDSLPRTKRLGSHPVRGLTLIEVIVSIVILSVLAIFSWGLHSSARNQSDRVTSLSNLRQCLMFLRNIANERNGVVPFSKLGSPWISTLWPLAYPNRPFPAWENDCSNLQGTFFYDPSVRYDLARGNTVARSFGLNVKLYTGPDTALRIQLNTVQRPTATALLTTVGYGSDGSGISSNLSRSRINFRLQNYTLAHVGFVDGHVQAMTKKELEIPLSTYEDVFWTGKD